MLEVVVVKQGQQILDKKYPLEHLQMVYPDVKYTDFVEKMLSFYIAFMDKCPLPEPS